MHEVFLTTSLSEIEDTASDWLKMLDDFGNDVSSHNALQIASSDRVHSNNASHKLSIGMEVKNLFCSVPGKNYVGLSSELFL